MKTILYVLVLSLSLIVLLTQCKKEPNHVKIPDDAFLNALIEAGVDTDGDGEISPAEAEAITYLDVNGEHIINGSYIDVGDISDLTGIKACLNLDTLICSYNKITSLDISNNTALHRLSLGHMPSLSEVCVWEIPFPPEYGPWVGTDGSPNVYFTTECSK
jgi:hypothetical protein